MIKIGEYLDLKIHLCSESGIILVKDDRHYYCWWTNRVGGQLALFNQDYTILFLPSKEPYNKWYTNNDLTWLDPKGEGIHGTIYNLLDFKSYLFSLESLIMLDLLDERS